MAFLDGGYRPSFWDDPGNDPGNAPTTAPAVTPPPLGAPLNAPVNGNYQLTVPGGGGGNGGGGGGIGKPIFNFPEVPNFVPPEFVRPSVEDAFKEPGYQFRLQSGENALQHSAAAKGLLRTGGTLKDITEYGQNFASNEYGNVFNRALNAYDRQYQGAKDKYAPRLAQWQMMSQGELQAALAQFAAQNRGGGGGGGGYNQIPAFDWNPYA